MKRFSKVCKYLITALLIFATLFSTCASVLVNAADALQQFEFPETNSASKDKNTFAIIEDLIVDNYFSGEDDGSKKAAAILTSGTLNTELSGVTIKVRPLPNVKHLVLITNNVLTTKKYNSNYEDLYWEPYAYTVNDSKYYFENNTEMFISASNYDSVQVEYRLTLSNITGFQDVLDLPYQLSQEADAQIEALEALNRYYNKMGDLGTNKFAILVLATAIQLFSDADADGNFDDPEMKNLHKSIMSFYSECFSGNSMIIYNLLTGYREEGLCYYYKNSAEFIDEIKTLDEYLTVIVNNKDVLKTILSDLPLDQSMIDKALRSLERLDELQGVVNLANNNLTAPNSAINVESENLAELTKAFELRGEIPIVNEQPLYISRFLVKAAEAKVLIQVLLQGVEVMLPIYNKGYRLAHSDIEEIIGIIEDKMTELGYSLRYYDSNYSRETFISLIGTDVTTLEDEYYDFTFTPKVFTISIEGAGDTTIDINNLEITLPSSNFSLIRYDYIVFDKTVSSGQYVFTAEEFDQIADAGAYRIERLSVNVWWENLINSVVSFFNSIIEFFEFVFVDPDG